MELRSWLADNQEEISRRWRGEIRIREDRRGEDSDGILGDFLQVLVSLLPPSLGEEKDQVEGVWHQAMHLYGTLALQRGLAAGEVVEQLQLLREVILKLLLDDSSVDWHARSNQRDILGLSRILDAGVVRASVAYVDDLFFSHLQGSGVPEKVTTEVEDEIRLQLKAFLTEVEGFG